VSGQVEVTERAPGRSLWDDFIGNNAAAGLLRASLGRGQVAHAYLFTGPDHAGKRTLALTFAAGLLCAAPWKAGRPCGGCKTCLQITKHTHPDVRLVEPEPGRRGVTIEQVRQLEHAAGLRPYQADRKVLILTNVEAMPEAAANALLKTLEEPPDDTILLLTASDVSQVLPTIASRCREVALRPVPAAEIEAALAARGVEAERAALLARLAGGRPGWALTALAEPAWLETRTEQIERLERLLARPRVGRLPEAAAFGDAPSARAALEVWLGWWRDALLVQQGCRDLVTNVDRIDALRRLGACHPPHVLWRALARVQETRQQLDANVNVRLAVEALLLDLPESTVATLNRSRVTEGE
jgi:DNA polymerase-3 subunit delta'